MSIINKTNKIVRMPAMGNLLPILIITATLSGCSSKFVDDYLEARAEAADPNYRIKKERQQLIQLILECRAAGRKDCDLPVPNYVPAPSQININRY